MGRKKYKGVRPFISPASKNDLTDSAYENINASYSKKEFGAARYFQKDENHKEHFNKSTLR